LQPLLVIVREKIKNLQKKLKLRLVKEKPHINRSKEEKLRKSTKSTKMYKNKMQEAVAAVDIQEEVEVEENMQPNIILKTEEIIKVAEVKEEELEVEDIEAQERPIEEIEEEKEDIEEDIEETEEEKEEDIEETEEDTEEIEEEEEKEEEVDMPDLDTEIREKPTHTLQLSKRLQEKKQNTIITKIMMMLIIISITQDTTKIVEPDMAEKSRREAPDTQDGEHQKMEKI
jgi:hypothetical protein